MSQASILATHCEHNAQSAQSRRAKQIKLFLPTHSLLFSETSVQWGLSACVCECHTLIDDSILVCHFGDVRIRSNAEVTGGLEKQVNNVLKKESRQLYKHNTGGSKLSAALKSLLQRGASLGVSWAWSHKLRAASEVVSVHLKAARFSGVFFFCFL